MVPPSAARDGEVARTTGECGGSEEVRRGQEVLELDELAASFLPEDDDELESLLESLFDDESDFESEPDDSLPLAFAAPDFDERLSVL
jgi:hypothetical protein